MVNYTWKDTILQIADLPEKAQVFIKTMGIDKDIEREGLLMMLLETDKNGRYVKSFDNKPYAVYDNLNNTIYFIKNLKVGKDGIIKFSCSHSKNLVFMRVCGF